MGDNLDYLGDKGLVGRDLRIPVLHEFLQDDGNEGIKLQIHIIATSQGW